MEERKDSYENVILPEQGFEIPVCYDEAQFIVPLAPRTGNPLYLNGHATVRMDDLVHQLNPLDAIVMDYSKIHEVLYELPQTMGICIHVSRNLLREYVPDTELLSISCSGSYIPEEKKEAYSRLCEHLSKLTVLYVNQKNTYRMRSTALILEILAGLLENFRRR